MNLENLQHVDQIVNLPVWFVQDENNLFIQSIAKSGKVKLNRTQPQERIAPCEIHGIPLGDRMKAVAFLVIEPEVEKRLINSWVRNLA